MSNSRIVRPIELKQKDQHMIGMAVSLFLLALSIALYPIYKRPAILYYSIFGTVLAILCFGFSYWVDSKKTKPSLKWMETEYTIVMKIMIKSLITLIGRI